MGPSHVLEGQDLEFLVKKQFREQKNKNIEKFGTNFGSYKKSWKFQNFILVPGVRKFDFYDFSEFCLRKNGPEIWESRVRRPGNHEWDDLGISSETTCEKTNQTLCFLLVRKPPVLRGLRRGFLITPVVSLVIPRSSHSWFPGRLTRDSQISRPFFHKQNLENS